MTDRTAFYVYSQSVGFDRDTADGFATKADAGHAILAYDQQSCGFDVIDPGGLEGVVPWQLPHRGPKKKLWNFGDVSEERCCELIADSDVFPLGCMTSKQADEFEAEINAD